MKLTKFKDSHDYEVLIKDDHLKKELDFLSRGKDVGSLITGIIDDGWFGELVIKIKRVKLGKSVWD
jgi:hypothetical protein